MSIYNFILKGFCFLVLAISFSNAGEIIESKEKGSCFLSLYNTSLDSLECKAVDGEGDCKCFAKKYSSLAPASERLTKVKQMMGEALKTSLKQGLYDIFRNAKEMSQQGIDLMSNSNVKQSCSLDSLARLPEKCSGGDKRVREYFNSSFDELIKSSIYIEAKNNEPLDLSKSSNDRCLSNGESREVSDRKVFKEEFSEAIKPETLNKYISLSRDTSFWKFIKDDKGLIGLINSNPRLKNIFKNKKLSKSFIPLLKKSIANKTDLNEVMKSFFKDKRNVDLAADELANNCKKIMSDVVNLICNETVSTAVGSKEFNTAAFEYTPFDFENGFDHDLASEVAEDGDIPGKTGEDVFADHIFYCQGKVQNIKPDCKVSNIDTGLIDPGCFLLRQESSVGSKIYEKKTSLGVSVEDKRNNKKYNEHFCKILFCDNPAEVLSGKTCKDKNPPFTADKLKDKLLGLSLDKGKCKDSLVFKSCPKISGSEISGVNDFSNAFKAMMEMIDTKIEKPSSSAKSSLAESVNEEKNQETSNKAKYKSFSDNFFKGRVGTLVEKSIETNKKITFKKFSELKAVVNLSQIAKNEITNPRRKSIGAKAGIASTAPLKKINLQGKNQTQRNDQPRKTVAEQVTKAAKTSANNSPDITYADYMKDMKELKDIGSLRERMASVQGELGTVRESSRRRELERELAGLKKKEKEIKKLAPKKLLAKVTDSSIGALPRKALSSAVNKSRKYASTQNQPRQYTNTTQSTNEVTEIYQEESGEDKMGISELPASEAPNDNSRAPASVAESNGAGGGSSTGGSVNAGSIGTGSSSSSAASANGARGVNLPYTNKELTESEAFAKVDSKDFKVIEVESLDNEIDLASLLIKNNYQLDKGLPFTIIHKTTSGNREVQFIPDYQNGKFKHVYIAKPIGDSDELLVRLQRASYWVPPRSSSSLLKNSLRRFSN